jgi:hypothetical protein
MVLPVRPKEPLHTFATSFWDMNKDAAMLVDEHRLSDLFNVAPNICGNGKEVGARHTLMVCIYS